MDNNKIVNLGEQRFDRLMEENRFYIDKTDFIKEWWESGSTVTPITTSDNYATSFGFTQDEVFKALDDMGLGDEKQGVTQSGMTDLYLVSILTFANAHSQIDEKRYEAELISEGFVSEKMRKYGFAFKGKECLIG